MRIRVLLAAAAVALLAGCGAGPNAQTALTQPSIGGVSANVGEIAVRNAVVPFAAEGYPAGGEAPVQFAIANNSRQPVRLTQVSSQAATSVAVESVEPFGATAPPAGGGAQVALAPGELANVTLRLTGLTAALTGTSSVPLTLTFDNGATGSMTVPMATPEQPLPRESPVTENGH